ncbi:class I SAM-dependent methyltransferase [Sporosarcina cyprini]|uniref:class I SAM-dependent methyltransferase n=1 Tax=Sporosarcina cyprini TaxID=2910523 RepID=UPI001EDCE3A7|nr:class I SAM-dependent methyltransferase [Sporosarcina cyprini]MCG3086434.1 class I SAM-dependent methyltransferase [Sporosarcina cyprini]
MTTNKWVLPFYQKQFEWLDSSMEDRMKEDIERQVDEVQEQVGRQFDAMLEIGAGSGILARGLSRRGVKMTTLELVPELVAFAKSRSPETITIHQGDFYTYDFEERFDVVGYFDGFGVGSDEEQLFLLKRMASWIKEDGCALIDIYQPTHWQKAAGQEMNLDRASRRYEYDDENGRMLDTWWSIDSPDEPVTQSLRCYTIEEISSLCREAGLHITGIFPGGKMDYDEWVYHPVAPLSDCLAYRIKVKKG